MCRILHVLEGSGRQNQSYFTCPEGSGRLNLSDFTCAGRLWAAQIVVFYTLRAGPPTQLSLVRVSF